jgi:ribonuclease Z
MLVKERIKNGAVEVDGKKITLDDVSHMRKGDALSVVIDTRMCPQALEIARGAKTLICESTYQEEHRDLAKKHFHLTAKEAAQLAKDAGVGQLILTHFSARYQSTKGYETEAKEVFPNVLIAEDLAVFPFEKTP